MKKSQYDYMFQIEETHWWFNAKRFFIAQLFPPNKKNLSILDVGCGTGWTSKYLERWGSVTRLEPSPYAVQYLQKRKVPFLPISIEHFHERNNSFDAVFILDVLYHKQIKNDLQTLEKIYKLLRPGGFLVITDCAQPWLMSHHDEEVEARERYTKKELLDKVTTSGFSVQRSTYMFFLVFPLFILQRLVDKIYPLQSVSEPPTWINGLLMQVCYGEGMLLRHMDFPYGSSLCLVAKK